jgi:anaerobic selenocysteine-containing dehydrogenase/ferredoxin-NADP reductase
MLPRKATNPSHRREVVGFCTFCRSRCGSINVIENGRLIEVKPNPAHPTGKALCPKGRAAPEIVHSAERLLYPLRRTQPKTSPVPGWERVSWEEALDDIAARMQAIAAQGRPEAVAFSLTSASASSISDARPWIERFIWSFGSPNICSSAELCNWHKDYSHALTFGRHIGSPDYANTDLAVLWGHNPSNTWLAQADALTAAMNRGAKLVVVDPRRTSLAARAALWLPLRPGTDGILAVAVARLLLASGHYDHGFVRMWTNAPLLVRKDSGEFLRASDIGIGTKDSFVTFDLQSVAPRVYDPHQATSAADAERFALQGEFTLRAGDASIATQPAFAIYRQALEQISVEDAAGATGVAVEKIVAFADLLGAAKRTCYYCWTGVGQHADSTQIDRAIATLFALKGQFDLPGGNVVWPGPRTNPVDDLQILSPQQRAKTLGIQEYPLGPALRSWVTAADLYRAIIEGEPYRVRALVCFGSNPLVSRSEPERGREALQQLDLQVHCDLFLNPTANTADYVLPVNSAWEREGVRVGFEISAAAQSLIQLRPAMVEAVGESRSDFWIVAELAKRLGIGGALFDGDFTRALDYMLGPSGTSVEALRAAPHGLTFPTENPLRSYANKTTDGVRGFATPTRRVELYSESLRRLNQPPVPNVAITALAQDFPLILTNAKAGHFCHTQHRQIAGLRQRTPEPHFSLSRAAAQSRGLIEGDPIEIRTRNGRVHGLARIDDHLDEHTVIGEFGWWQACDDLGEPGYPITGADSRNFNVLTSTAEVDPVSATPRFRSLACEVARAPLPYERWTGFTSLEVASVRPEAGAIFVVELVRPDRGLLPPHRCGQFISIGLEGVSQTRSYSLINASREQTDRYVLAIKREAHGTVSPAMASLRAGAIVRATMPSGRFTLPRKNARPVCLIAFGVGITPFLSLLETLALQPDDAPEVVLCYSAPAPQAQAFRERLVEIARVVPRLQLRNFYSRIDDPSARRLFTVASLPHDLIERRARFYICGSPAATSESRQALEERGVPRFEIFEEKFQSPTRAVVGETVQRRITLARSSREVIWDGTGSILDAVSRHGISMASGCRVGQCESCAVRVLQGAVSHAEPPEYLDEGFCLTCVAVPVTDIVLDV